MKKPLTVGAALAALVAMCAGPTAAMPSTGRIHEGEVTHVNLAERTAVLSSTDGSPPREFTWVSRTVVFAGSDEACPAEIREGMSVRIVRHVPVFGRPFATRINLPASAISPGSVCDGCATKRSPKSVTL